MVIADIRLPDMTGYEFMLKLQEIMETAPLVLMTGFGWDPGHSIVKARQAGLAGGALQAVPSRPTAERRGTDYQLPATRAARVR